MVFSFQRRHCSVCADATVQLARPRCSISSAIFNNQKYQVYLFSKLLFIGSFVFILRRLLIISVDCGFAQAQPSQSRAINSPPDCFLNALTVQQKIKFYTFVFTKLLYIRGFVFLIAPHLNFCKKLTALGGRSCFYVTILLFLDQLIGKVCRAREQSRSARDHLFDKGNVVVKVGVGGVDHVL